MKSHSPDQSPPAARVCRTGAPPLHLIRLQGPWQLEVCSPAGTIVAGRSVRLPLSAGDELFPAAACRLLRRFQKPNNLAPDDRVLLVLPPDCQPVELRINDCAIARQSRPAECLGATGQDAWDLTDRLERSNVVTLVFAAADGPRDLGLTTPIRLAIGPLDGPQEKPPGT